jgi:hypothetical protein
MRGKSHRKEVAKTLQAQIAATTDPKLIIELSNQLSKFLPRPRQARRPRKPVEAAPSKGKASLLTRVHHNGVDDLSPTKKFSHFIVIEFEKGVKEHRKSTGRELTEVEKETLWVYVQCVLVGQLTEEDRTLLLADTTDPEALTKIFEAYDADQADQAALKGR